MNVKKLNIIYFTTFMLLVGVNPAYDAGTSVIRFPGVGVAHGAGTLAGEHVVNTATVTYGAGLSTSTSVTVVVDRNINFTVTRKDPNYVSMGPGNNLNRPLIFDIKNDSNDTLDFRLEYIPDATGDASPTGFTPSGRDTFDTTSVRIFLDTPDPTTGNKNNIFDSSDRLVPFDSARRLEYLDEIPANHATNSLVRIFVVSNMPATNPTGGSLNNGDISGGTLIAVAAEDGGIGVLGRVHLPTRGVNSPMTVENVFADQSGVVATDIVNDGKHSDDSAYRVETADLTATKTFSIIDDHATSTLPGESKAIPGAIVEYCVSIENKGLEVANTVVMTDNVPVNSTFINGSIKVNVQMITVPGQGKVCDNTTGTPEDNNNVRDTVGGVITDDITLGPIGSFTPPTGAPPLKGTVRTEVSTLNPGATAAFIFRVTID